MAQTYTPEFRAETADYVLASGKTIKECCRELERESEFLKKAAAFFART